MTATYPTQGTGFVLFAAIVLVVAGIMRIIDAIWAWANDGTVPDAIEEAILGDSLNTYGWLWFIVGILMVLAGLAVMQGAQWARWIGIAAGAVMAVTAITWMPVYPVWSLVYIMIGIYVIYGLAAYGGRSHMA